MEARPSDGTRIKVVVFEPRRLLREGMRALLDERAAVQVAAAVSDPAELVATVEQHNPSAVILGLDRADDQLWWALEQLRRTNRRYKLIGTMRVIDIAIARNAHRLGVTTLVPTEKGVDAVVAAIFSPVVSSLPEPSLTRDSNRSVLTPREVDVLRLISLGLTAREISSEMAISPKTVENHKQRIFRKLNVQNQAHAISVALRRGIISPAQGGLIARSS